MTDIVISIFLLLGTFTTLVGAIGLIRFPDVLNRMHATGKASTLGTIGILVAGTIFFSTGEYGLTLKLLLVVPFLFWTSPAGVYMIGETAHSTGALAPETIRDDLARKAGTLSQKQ